MYIVDYEALDNLKNAILGQISGTNLVLDTLKTTLRTLSETDSFTGTGADSIKSYVSLDDGVYATVFNAFDQITQAQHDVILVYIASYMQYIDIGNAVLHAYINTDEIESIRQTVVNSTNTASGIVDNIHSLLDGISDIYSHEDIESIYNLMNIINYDALVTTDTTITNLETDIETMEAIQWFDMMCGATALAITDLANLLDSMYAMQRYDSNSFAQSINLLTPQMDAVQESTQMLTDLHAEYEDMISEAERYNLERVRVQSEIAQAREDQAVINLVTDAGIVILGVACIIVTWGAATPFVFAGGALVGSASVVYGGSRAIEHTQDYVYGANGDIISDSYNPVRDSIFQGNQTLYDGVGNTCVLVGSLVFIPAGQGLTMGLNAGLSGNALLRPVITKISISGMSMGLGYGASTVGSDCTIYYINGIRTVNGMSELSPIQEQWIRLGSGTVVGAVSYGMLNSMEFRWNISGAHTFTEYMSPADAERYQIYWDQIEYDNYMRNLDGPTLYSDVQRTNPGLLEEYCDITPENIINHVRVRIQDGEMITELAWPSDGGFVITTVRSVRLYSIGEDGTFLVSRCGSRTGRTVSIDVDGNMSSISQRSILNSNAEFYQGTFDFNRYIEILDVINDPYTETYSGLEALGISSRDCVRLYNEYIEYYSRGENVTVMNGIEQNNMHVGSGYGFYGETAPWGDLEGGATQINCVFSWDLMERVGIISGHDPVSVPAA